MFLQRVITFTKDLEDPKNPVLGPTLKGLYLFGLWQTGSKFHTTIFKIFHFSTFLFMISQFIGLYIIKNDTIKVLNNISVIGLNTVCVAKCYGYVLSQPLWRQLAQEISEEELTQIRNRDVVISKLMRKYTKYTRIVTYLFWMIVLASYLLLNLSLLFRYLSSKTYLDDIENDLEPLPLISYSWFPFDSSRMPGYLGAVLVQIVMVTQAAGLVAVYDMNAVAIMSYLKGQMLILKYKCKTIFQEAPSRNVIRDRIRECHRLHNTLVKHHEMFNNLLSPTMFIYVLICAITICCSVLQFSSKEVTTSHKMIWVVPYSVDLIFQLFLYSWHSNEVIIESGDVDQGVYASDWWKADVLIRREILLLAGKLRKPLKLQAGPYTTLSVPTFVQIMKGTYSFYTLISQMRDE